MSGSRPDTWFPPPDRDRGLEAEAARYLRGLPGVLAAAPLSGGACVAVMEAEDDYERAARPAVANLGVRQALAREHAVALLKDASFRRPPIATLYLVEEGEAPEAETIRVAERCYHVLGEECPDGVSPEPGAFSISDTFHVYPARRSNARRAACFLLPPVPFPELESGPWLALVSAVVSSSPSAAADLVLRRLCGFAQDPRLATLVLGFDTRAVRSA